MRSDRKSMALNQQMTQLYMKMSRLIIKRAQFVSDRISHTSCFKMLLVKWEYTIKVIKVNAQP